MTINIDSYEYYLMFHENKIEFLAQITSQNREIFIAIQKLLVNKKLKENEKEIVFDKTIEIILNDKNSDFILDEIIENTIASKSFSSFGKLLLTDPDSQKLRVLSKFVDYALIDPQISEEFLKEIAIVLVDEIFKEGEAHPYIISILKRIVLNDNNIGEMILYSTYEKCLERKDRLGLQNLCYFFDKVCDKSIFKFSHLIHLTKYFKQNNRIICKQGVFLIKILIEKNLLQDEMNWKTFITIMETLEESSYLSLPTLELLYRINISNEFEEFWFIICRQILEHQGSLVRNWGLNYIMNIEYYFKSEQIKIILDSLNFTSLFDTQVDHLTSSLKKFIKRNFHVIFDAMNEINWLTVPFYHILKEIKEYIELTRPIISKDQLKNFQNQTQMLPKKIKNVAFRPIIQNYYAEILLVIMETGRANENLSDFIQILINVFKISNHPEYLDSCFKFVRYEDYDLIFNDNTPYEFLKYALIRLHIDRSLSEIKSTAKNITFKKILIMDVICCLNKIADSFEDCTDELIHETIDEMWTNITRNQLDELHLNIEVLEIGLNSIKNGIEIGYIDQLIEMLSKIECIETNSKDKFGEIYNKILNIILKYRKKSDVAYLKMNGSFKNLTTIYIELKNSVDENYPPSFYINIINEMSYMLDNISSEKEYLKIFELLENISENTQEKILMDEQFKAEFLNFYSLYVIVFNNHLTISIEFWIKLIIILFKIVEKTNFSSQWITSIEDVFENNFNNFTAVEKCQLLLAILKMSKNSKLMDSTNNLGNFFKTRLAEKIFEVDVMTKDQQIELKLINKIEPMKNDKLWFRLDVSLYLNEKFNEKFMIKIKEKILSLSKISKKKPRYYSNSNIHRLKLHHFQTLLFCKTIEKDVMDALIFDLLWINNQLNIQYLLEIIISKHHKNFILILNDENLKIELKPQSLKSIFSIAVIQIKAQMNFEIAEKMLDEIYHIVFPFSMGQNFGVRIYALLTIALSYEHVKNLKNGNESSILSKMDELYNIINESVKQKNSFKYFNALKNDFRFTIPLSKLLSTKYFYHLIPAATNMPFEEIITIDEAHDEKIIVADMLKVNDQIIKNDELELTVEVQSKDGSINLQQKYIPFKYQIPGDNLISSIPNGFKFYDTDGKNKNVELVVVASLIDRNANLGGLARTCEIFGASNYVINSLKSTENFEFKSLSKTAEKWIKISEIKSWQLSDYLITMKKSGYKIVGAEQSGSSVSLLNAELPKKCVLLLGNESTGVPADLLSLMDIIVEIPQCGVIRSLNVHVTGAILIWEYAKKFNLFMK